MYQAAYQVVNIAGQTVGYLINNKFRNLEFIRQNIEQIENMELLNNGTVAAKEAIPQISYKKAVIEPRYLEIASENPFIRDIQETFAIWKNNFSKDTILQLDGTRQIGKTTEVLKFAYSHYEYVIYINLANDRYHFISFAESCIDSENLNAYCQAAMLPDYVDNNSTILIIDEIQQSAKIYNMLRELREHLKCDIIVTGSYLGRRLGNREFFLPAGTITYAQMFHLSFQEFCRVFQQDKLLNEISLYGESKDEDYRQLEDLYKIYIQIGGYPRVVKEYVKTQEIARCHILISSLLETFKEESSNYFQQAREVEIFEAVYTEALKNMCREKKGATGKNTVDTITEFVIKNTKLIVNRDEISNAITWIKYAGIIGVCDLAVNGDLQNIAKDRRYYFTDCGIVSYLAARSIIDESALIGILAETFVYNELHRLFKTFDLRQSKVLLEEVCFSTYNNYELDFMVADRNKVIYGIEVKSTKGTPNSLKIYLDKHFVEKGIVAKTTKGGRGEQFHTIPIYTVGCRFPYQ